MPTKTSLSASKEKTGFAAFIDLRDSTYVWNLNADIAEEILNDLNDVTVTQTKMWGGKIGNFTGDGFLLLFEQAEFAIRGLAAVINAWEERREHYRIKLQRVKVPLPDEQHSLSLRTGVAFGNYRRISSGKLKGNVAGEAINHASRCEGASKAHFEAIIENAPASLNSHQRVFIAASVYNLISKKTDYWYSTQLKVEHKGYEQSTGGGPVKTTDFIYAFWPKADQLPGATAQTPKPTLQRVAAATAQSNAADRLLEAKGKIAVGDELSDAAQGALGKTARDVLSRAIAAYRAALKTIHSGDAPSYYASTQNKLGNALRDQANLLAGEDRANRLNQAVETYREALKVRTLEAAPADYAGTQNNLGNALCDQAALLKGKPRAAHLIESRRAFKNALKVFDANHHPHEHAIAKAGLARTVKLSGKSSNGKK